MMTPIQALELLDSAAARSQGTRQDHLNIAQAVVLIRAALRALQPVEVKLTPPKDKEETKA
jgi:hypothetical protein